MGRTKTQVEQRAANSHPGPTTREMQPAREQHNGPARAQHTVFPLPLTNDAPSPVRAAGMIGDSVELPPVPGRARMSFTIQRSIGNARVASLLRGPQAKIPVGEPSDRSKQEAGEVASRVVSEQKVARITRIAAGEMTSQLSRQDRAQAKFVQKQESDRKAEAGAGSVSLAPALVAGPERSSSEVTAPTAPRPAALGTARGSGISRRVPSLHETILASRGGNPSSGRAGMPRFVYLASGYHLTQRTIAGVKRQVQRLFAIYRKRFDASWFITGEEDGMPTLLLRWQSEWGMPPSQWMGPERLAVFLHSQFASESYVLATEPYEEEALEAEFSEDEQRWIKDVLSLPEISQLFRTFAELPPVVLHRVSRLKSGGQGQARGKEVAVSSRAYEMKEYYKEEGQKRVEATPEEEFKSTLIHELLHFVETQTAHLAKKVGVPRALKSALVYPEGLAELELNKYAFGWFEHPTAHRILHLDQSLLFGMHPELTIIGTPLEEVYKKKQYESSPMPQSGMRIDPEEDLAATLSLYLTSERSRNHLQSRYPLRYKLMEWYFNKYLPRMEKKRLQKGGF